MDREKQFLHRLLASGVQVVGQPMAGVESAAFGILIGAGARDEQPRQFGIAHLAEQMLFRGTAHLDARQLSDQFDALGISYDSSSGVEMTLLSAVMLGDRLPAAIDLLTDVVRYPAFPADLLPTVQSLVGQERRQREDQPGQRVMEALRHHVYQRSPLGHDVLGSEETVAALEQGDLLDFWNHHGTANNTIISVAGKFDWDATIDQLERVTADWMRGSGRMVMHEPRTYTGTVILPRETSQENLALGFPGVSVVDPHYYAARLATQILGGGMNSRLFQEVREKRGLAYAVSARFDGMEKTGLFRIYVGTTAQRAHESVAVVLEELGKLQASGVTEDELRLAKTKLKSQTIMRSESTLARMSANLRSWWFEQELHTLDDIRERIDRVTGAEIHQLIEALAPLDHLAAVALGPRSQEELFGRLPARTGGA